MTTSTSFSFPYRKGLIAQVAILVVVLQADMARSAHILAEQAFDRRVFNVAFRLKAKGKLETALRGGKAQEHDFKVEATIDYRERRLSGAGRDAAALRSLRYYDKTDVAVNVDKQATSSQLPARSRMIVAQVRREGVAPYSMAGPLSAVELELLRVSGDSLAILGLLPHKPVEEDEEWICADWVLQMLTGTEAVVKSDLKCKLVSVKRGIAKVEYEGKLEGASAGAATKISVTGKYSYDLKHRHITHFELNEKERRKLGTRPGYDIEAKVVIERSLAKSPGPLTDELAESIPLEPGEERLLLRFALPWGARFHHDRNWHLFRQTEKSAVLRLLDKGSFIAQCDIAKITDVGPGKHTSEQRFQQDIHKALGSRLKEIVKAELLKSEDNVYRYRVTIAGESNGVPMTWLYYLCAAPSGKQMAYVFAVESKLVDRLASRDLAIVGSTEFFDLNIKPASVEP